MAEVRKVADEAYIEKDWNAKTITIAGIRRSNQEEFDFPIGTLQGTAVDWDERFLQLIQKSRLRLNLEFKAKTGKRSN